MITHLSNNCAQHTVFSSMWSTTFTTRPSKILGQLFTYAWSTNIKHLLQTKDIDLMFCGWTNPTINQSINQSCLFLIIRKHIKVVSIDGLLAILAAFRKQTCYFHYFMYLSIFLFVENKFFLFFFLVKNSAIAMFMNQHLCVH